MNEISVVVKLSNGSLMGVLNVVKILIKLCYKFYK